MAYETFDLNERKAQARKGTVIIVVGVVVMLMLMMINIILAVIAGIIIIAVGMMMRSAAATAIKEYMTQEALLPALQANFDNVDYRPYERIPDDVIRNTDLGFNFHIDIIEGNDYVKASYHGVNFELSDITLKTIEHDTDSDGHRTEREVEHFKGMWLICDFAKGLSADIRLREREGVFDKFAKGSIQTESDSFNKQFVIHSDNDHDVFYVLTPHMMEYIQKMDAKANGRTYMRFHKEGKVTVALSTGRDAFEVKSISKATVEDLRVQFTDEVQYIKELIDELRLVKIPQ